MTDYSKTALYEWGGSALSHWNNKEGQNELPSIGLFAPLVTPLYEPLTGKNNSEKPGLVFSRVKCQQRDWCLCIDE